MTATRASTECLQVQNGNICVRIRRCNTRAPTVNIRQGAARMIGAGGIPLWLATRRGLGFGVSGSLASAFFSGGRQMQDQQQLAVHRSIVVVDVEGRRRCLQLLPHPLCARWSRFLSGIRSALRGWFVRTGGEWFLAGAFL